MSRRSAKMILLAILVGRKSRSKKFRRGLRGQSPFILGDVTHWHVNTEGVRKVYVVLGLMSS